MATSSSVDLLNQLRSRWKEQALRYPVEPEPDRPHVARVTTSGAQPAGRASRERVLDAESYSLVQHQPDAHPEPVFVDLETRSKCSLKCGGRRYAIHPSTEIVSAVFVVDRDLVIWTPGREIPAKLDQLGVTNLQTELTFHFHSGDELPPLVRDALRAGRSLCAHNASGFDSHVWRAKGLPEPDQWIDTLPLARAAGLPGKLDAIGLYVAAVGPHRVFPGAQPRKESEITDGVSNTIAVIEHSDSKINWLEPRDGPPGAPAGSGAAVASGNAPASNHPKQSHALFIDGSVHSLPDHLERHQLDALMTVDGGEMVPVP